MAPTLYEKIWDAVNREPRINRPETIVDAAPTHHEGPVEVFNVGAEAPAAHHHRYGGGQNVARPGSVDGDRINSLQTTVTAIQAVVATDPQQARDLAHFARFANDAIRVHSGLVK